MSDDAHAAMLQRLTTQLTDEGKLIEAGWVSLRLHAISPSAGPTQLREMRLAFKAGAQHVFASIMTVLEPGNEPSTNDLRRMSLIEAELAAVAEELKRAVARKPT